MVFWGIVVAVLAVALLVGWRVDRRHPGTRISRRNGAAESDIARAEAEARNRLGTQNRYGSFGG